MTHPEPHAGVPAGPDHRACEACGAQLTPEATAPLFEIPVPAAVAGALGLAPGSAKVLRVLCTSCLAKGLDGCPITLAELVDMAPASMKQVIHEHLIHEFEI